MMRAHVVLLCAVVALGCAPPRDEALVVIDAGDELYLSTLTRPRPLRGKRRVGCRERMLRMSLGMCDPQNAVVPAIDATAGDLWVIATPGLSTRECYDQWLLIAHTCPSSGEEVP